jgi:hypothetical protein
MLTNSELVLGAAGIGVLGSAVGALIAWGASLSSAVAASETQRQLEADRRRTEQRSALYETTLLEMDRAERIQRQNAEARSTGAPQATPNEQEVEKFSAWGARLHLYASLEVLQLWRAWLNALVAEADLSQAKVAVVAQMRAEVDPLIGA